jgi:hypothetical protein
MARRSGRGKKRLRCMSCSSCPRFACRSAVTVSGLGVQGEEDVGIGADLVGLSKNVASSVAR